jgi:pimeloyl-ACP methyl ester carboxylesterase
MDERGAKTIMNIKTPNFELAVITEGDASAAKIAFVLPGRLDTKDYPHMRSHLKWLANIGFFAVSFDPPGTWESSGDIALYTLQNYMNAVKELHAHYGSKPVLFVGHSFGGFMALTMAVHTPECIGVVDIMGYADFDAHEVESAANLEWKEKGIYTSRRDSPLDSTKYVTFNLPYSFQLSRIGAGVKTELNSATFPKLFIYGTEDTMVTPQDVQEAYNASANPKKIVASKGSHDYRRSSERIQEMNDILSGFIQEHQL